MLYWKTFIKKNRVKKTVKNQLKKIMGFRIHAEKDNTLFL